AMPTSFNVDTASAGDDICSICYDALSTKRIICLHPCQHRFHRTCIMSWFESRQQFIRRQFTCCLCRTYASRHKDERGQHVPPMLALEVKENERDFADRRLRFEGLVRFWTSINRILESLREDKHRAVLLDKCSEYVEDIDDEMEKLRTRAELTEKIFVSHSLRSNQRINALNENMRTWMETVDQGGRTMDQLMLLEKNLDRASSELRKEKDAATTSALIRFRELCEAEI
ncbi:hypothetical protein PRIPAC_91603, partial [Pristionchus pacificus]|uniref:RING-type domain-containing protein n=1 Tax=Pristionchus pacificus TaxID=54126 RepID=A0A2A6BBI7_PRIPA